MKKRLIFLSLLFVIFFSSYAYAVAPVASITAPANGSTFNEGNTVTFLGTATDLEDGVLTANALAWFSTLDGPIGTGSTSSRSDLSEGTHTITLVATDSAGEIDQATISITITNPAPVVNITSPANNAVFTANNTITFIGSAIDTQDGPLSGSSMIWSSDIDGQIGTGENFSTSILSIGPHTITLKATDSHGASTTTNITLTVQNTQPTATIQLPLNASTFTTGETISFQGRGDDNEDGAILNDTLVWTSSLDGAIGTGPTFSTNALAAGSHTITLTATDSNGLLSAPTTITITVTNVSPTPIITTPSNNDIFQQGDTITFAGVANDPEDGALTGSNLVWSSNKDGTIGTGTEVKISSLSSGSHTITLTATDSDGLSNTTTVTIIAGNQAPVPTIITPADKQIFQDKDTVDFYGTAIDPEDGNLTGSRLVWYSSRDGKLGEGSNISTSTLSAGEHLITFTATDSYNASASASLTIQYGNLPPTATIMKPDNNAQYELGQDVIFHGSGTDTEDGNITGSSLLWESNSAGLVTQVGTGASFSVNSLKSGTHEITLTVTDSGNATATAKVTITIKEMVSDKSSLSIKVPNTGTFTVTGGTPPFQVFSRRSNVASAIINERVVTITSKTAGESEIIVTDSVQNALIVPVTISSESNLAPTASALLKKDGMVQMIVTSGDALTLDGSMSSDDFAITSYRWEQLAGSIPVYLDNEASSSPSFTAPPVSGNQKFIFRLTVKDNEGVSDYDDVEFVITEKNDSYQSIGSDIFPVESGTANKYLGVKYLSGLIKASATSPGSDTRNRPKVFKYNLVDMEKNLGPGETAATFIVYLPENETEESSAWYQENNALGWQNLTAASSPLNNGAYFNDAKDQVFINIQDNGDYDLDPSSGKVRTLSGIGYGSDPDEKPNTNVSSSSGGGCFIKSLF